MSHTKTEIALVDGPYPNIKIVEGLSFKVGVLVSGRDISGMESERILADAHRLVRAWNELRVMESQARDIISQARGEA